jgi:hypothetical protein
VCEANSDCAEGYQCLSGGGNTTGGSTGSSEAVCGDGWCDSSEIDICEADCVSVCQQVLDTCEIDADCDEGYFCDFNQGISSVSSSDGGTTVLGLCALNGTTEGTSDVTSTATTTAGGGDAGQSSDDTSNGSGDSNNLATVSAATTGGSSDGGGNSSNGGPGAGGSGSGGSGHGNGNGHGNGHGNGNGGGWHPWPHPGNGCSVGGGSDSASGGAGTMLFALSAALGWVATRRRRVI